MRLKKPMTWLMVSFGMTGASKTWTPCQFPMG